MYYLDLSTLHKRTTKQERIKVRRELWRDEIMSEKLENQNGLCFYCADYITMADHLDHVIPVYWGGDNKKRNLVASCKNCNLIKGTDHIEITNPYTINDYLGLVKAYEKYKNKPWAHKVKRYQLYKVYRADLFKEA